MLDWEQDEALGVFLEQRLVCLLPFNGGRDRGVVVRRLFELCKVHLGHTLDFDGDLVKVLLVGGEVELFYRRVAHLELLDAGASLHIEESVPVLEAFRMRMGQHGSARTCLDGVIWVAI